MDYQQICYARTGMQGVGSGWQTLNVSSGVPGDAEMAFSRVHAGSVSNVAGVSPAGKLCQVRELRADGPYVFLTMLTYGVPDQRRRPSAFAHGLVFERGAFERNPQIALCVQDESFGYKAEDTKPEDQHIKTAAPLTLAAARALLGLTDQGYENLLTCVYDSLGMNGATARPFEAECSCTPEILHALLTCVYQGLPLGMRARFSFSTMATNRGMPVSMVVTQKASGRAFVLATGEVRAGALDRQARRSDSAAQKMYPVCMLPVRSSMSENELAQVYEGLEKQVETFSDPGTASTFAYQLAFEQLADRGMVPAALASASPRTDADVLERLKGCLALPIPTDARRTAERDRLLDYALGEVIERNIALDDEDDRAVGEQLARTQLDALKDTGFAYNVQALSRKTPQEGAAYLERQYPDAEARSGAEFLRLRAALVADRAGNGPDIVTCLYANCVAARLAQKGAGLSLDELEKFNAEVDGLADPRIASSYVELCGRYARFRVVPNGDPAELVRMARELFVRAGLAQQDMRRIGDDLLNQYWEQFDFSSYGFLWEPYAALACPTRPEAAAAEAAAAVVLAARARDDESLVQRARAYAQAAAGLDARKAATLRGGLTRAVLSAYGPQTGCDLGVWYAVGEVLAGQDGPVAFLLEHGMLPDDKDLLEAALDRALDLQGTGMLEQLQAECERLSKAGVACSHAAGAVVRGIRGYLKRLRKEERRAARGSGGVFGTIRRTFGADGGAGAYRGHTGAGGGAYGGRDARRVDAYPHPSTYEQAGEYGEPAASPVRDPFAYDPSDMPLDLGAPEDGLFMGQDGNRYAGGQQGSAQGGRAPGGPALPWRRGGRGGVR